ncbi:MAG: P1 family peptidase [Kineosporiaceae bacterium]
MNADPRPGPTNSLTDVAGVRVGHAARRGDGWLTGTTVVLAPPGGAVAGVDVRGGGPGTRETDVLDPRTLVERIHAVVLTGGSAFGLAAADGVMHRLSAAGIGYPVPVAGGVIAVPIVPAAVIFDLGRGGDPANHPDASFGEVAYDCASDGPVPQGVLGAGTGAKAGGLKGGVGSASAVLEGGTTVAALVVVNAIGSCVDPVTGELYAVRFGLPGEFERSAAPSRRPQPAPPTAGPGDPSGIPQATTLGVIATDAVLTTAQCAKVSGVGHDGLARAIRPVHTMFDGDTLFTLATGAGATPDALAFHALLSAAGDCVTRAIGHAMLAAEPVSTAEGLLPSYGSSRGSASARLD